MVVSRAAALAQAAAFLGDMPAAWDAADQEQRNALARLIFQSVEVRDGRVIATVPTPDFAPFFVAAAPDTEAGQAARPAPDRQPVYLTGGSDGSTIARVRWSNSP